MINIFKAWGLQISWDDGIKKFKKKAKWKIILCLYTKIINSYIWTGLFNAGSWFYSNVDDPLDPSWGYGEISIENSHVGCRWASCTFKGLNVQELDVVD